MRHWDRRLLTQEGDRELMTRHETQERCPEILITNYSMLEFMLMRPIERPIFRQTRDWLRADTANELILVLDEAHMYRGAGGAEVALLLRRLLSRLDVSRERVRFILTSASLGSGDEATQAITQFGRDLTGLSDDSPRDFEVVRGTREARQGDRDASGNEASALHEFDLAAFEQHAMNPEAARNAVKGLSAALGWPEPSAGGDLQDFLFERLTGFGQQSGLSIPSPALRPLCPNCSAIFLAALHLQNAQRHQLLHLPPSHAAGETNVSFCRRDCICSFAAFRPCLHVWMSIVTTHANAMRNLF